jgi:hypothetical protein
MRAALCAVAAVAAGCSAERAAAGFSIRDSAGVEIVESRAPAWTERSAWHVDSVPILVIGDDQRDPARQFSGIRDVTRLRDGQVVVADYETQQLRWFDAGGRLRMVSGGRGQGPGEFEFLEWVHALPGDSLLVFDGQLARTSVYDSAGNLVRTASRGGELSAPTPIARFSDGLLLARVGIRPPGPPPLGHVRYTAAWIRMTPDLKTADTITVRRGGEGYAVPCGQGPSGRPTGICNYSPFFARVEGRAGWDGRLYLGDGERPEIDVFTADGRMVRSIRRAMPLRRVTSADLERQREDLLSRYGSSPRRAAAERVLAELPVHETMPAFASLLVDALGNLWVEEYRVASTDAPRWTVFDSAGRMLGTLAVPASLRIFEIGADELLGVARDSLDIEQVRAYRVRKPS